MWLLIPSKKRKGYVQYAAQTKESHPVIFFSSRCGGFSSECRVDEPVPGAQSRRRRSI